MPVLYGLVMSVPGLAVDRTICIHLCIHPFILWEGYLRKPGTPYLHYPLGGLPPKARKPLFRSPMSVCVSVTLIPTYVPNSLSPSHFHLELSTDRQNDSNVHGIVDGQNLLYIWYVRYFSYVEFFLTHGLLSTICTYIHIHRKKRDLNVGPRID